MMRPTLICFPLLLLTACAHVTEKNGDTGPAMYHPWKEAPGISLEDALAKARGSSQVRAADLSKGFVLEIGRGSYHGGPNYWWFEFKLLPLSPDYEIIVRVYDTGKIE